MRYEVIETDGKNAMRDAAKPFAVVLHYSKRFPERYSVVSRHATMKQASAAKRYRENNTPVR
jgi:hypothetical protein